MFEIKGLIQVMVYVPTQYTIANSDGMRDFIVWYGSDHVQVNCGEKYIVK